MTGPIRQSTGERMQDAFVESPTRANQTAVEVLLGNASDITGSGLLSGVTYDYGTVEYPSSTQEIYKFYLGGSGGVLVATVTLNYLDVAKENLSTFEVIK